MGYKILIVDDEPDIVAMLASFLTGKGYEVLTAHTQGKELQVIEI